MTRHDGGFIYGGASRGSKTKESVQGLEVGFEHKIEASRRAPRTVRFGCARVIP